LTLERSEVMARGDTGSPEDSEFLANLATAKPSDFRL